MNSPSFIETIRIRNGVLENLFFHKKRMFETCKKFDIDFKEDYLENIIIPRDLSSKELKLRIIYSKDTLEQSLEIYKRRKINSLKLIEANDIDYSFKYENRDKLNNLLKQKEDADEILIIKNGFITDTSFSNIVLLDQSNQLFTPTSYLLNGTQRQNLLSRGIIKEIPLTPKDLPRYKSLYLINALNEPLDTTPIAIENIY